MKISLKLFLVCILPLFAFSVAHKYYMSVTQVDYSEKNKSLQVTSRIFIDDFEKLLEERYNVKTALATPDEAKNVDSYIEKYLKQKFVLKLNSKPISFNFIGKEYDNDIIKCYIEYPNIELETIQSIEVQNTILMDVFNEQQNIIHFKLGKKKKSIILIRENNKGMLKL